MQDIKSTIRIEDGFTETLENLSKSAYKSVGVLDELKESIVECNEALKEQIETSKTFAYAQAKALDRSFSLVTNTAKTAAMTIAGNLKRIYTNTINSARQRAVKTLSKDIVASRKESIEYLKGVDKRIEEVTKHINNNSALSRKQKKEAIKNLHDSYDANIKIVRGKIKNETDLINKLKEEKDTFKLIRDGAKVGLKEQVSGTKELLKTKTAMLKADLASPGFMIDEMGISAYNLKNKVTHAPERIKNKLMATKSGQYFGNLQNTYAESGLKAASGVVKKDIAKGVVDGVSGGAKKLSQTEGFKIAQDFGMEFGKVASGAIITAVSFALFHKLKDKFVDVFMQARQAIQNSLEDLDTTNKLTSMYGKAGETAKRHAFNLANEIGEDAGKISEMAAKAAYQGIGQDDFDRIMRLSDKIGKLSPMETTESAANNLISNIKSGHDAGSFTQMLGGGQKMERQLRRAGFERALNHGDVSKALDIAEKITAQAGLTDDKYKTASQSMSENFKKIENVASNIKHRIAEIYVEQLAPAVEKVKDFIESENFQTFLSIAEKGIKIVGKLVADVIDELIDNLPYLGALFGMGMVAQSYLFIKNLGGILGLLKLTQGALVGIFKWLGATKIAGAIQEISVKTLKTFLKTKAIAALKVAGPWLLLGAAIGAGLKLLHHFFGKGKSFKDWLMGSIAGVYQLFVNVMHNIFAFGERLMNSPKNIILGLKKLGIYIKRGFVSLYQWIMDKISDGIESVIPKPLLEQLGYTRGGAFGDWANDIMRDSAVELRKINDELEELNSKATPFVPIMTGVKKAMETNGESVKQMLKGLFGSNKKQEESEEKTATNSDLIRRQGEQEEELRWLKAFSDRQITSSYSSMTSNVRNLTINGMSQTGMTEFGRRNLSSMPTRASM